MKKFKVIVVPSEDDQYNFDNAHNFTQAKAVMNSNEDSGGTEFIFDMMLERDAFIQGFNAGTHVGKCYIN